MSYKIEIQKDELYPENPSSESVSRNPGGSTVKRWRPLKYVYPSEELAIKAVDHIVADGESARVVDGSGGVVWDQGGRDE